MRELASRLRGFDGVALGLVLILGYGDVPEWALVLALLLVTLVLLERRLGRSSPPLASGDTVGPLA